jgi:hypothetical protein
LRLQPVSDFGYPRAALAKVVLEPWEGIAILMTASKWDSEPAPLPVPVR